MKFLVPVCVLLCVVFETQALKCQNGNQCCDVWKLVYENNANGGPVTGNIHALLAAILAGSRVRVSIGDNLFQADSVTLLGGNAYAQLLQTVGIKTYKTFQSDVYWVFHMASTTGDVENVRYFVGKPELKGKTTSKAALKWFVKSSYCVSEPKYSNTETGHNISGSLQDLKTAVDSGYEISAITKRDKIYAFPMQNIQYDDSKVAGQLVDHVSQKVSGNNIVFQENAYWWFTIVSTSGKRDMSRWTVGDHTSRGHTSDTTPTEWFQDPCWELLYTHDENGKAVEGRLSALVSAIQSGRRVRFQIPAHKHYTAEADNLSILKGHVTAQALKHISKASIEKMKDDGYWYWLMVSTTGTLRETRYKIGAHEHIRTSKEQNTVKWFADTRPWTLALEHNSAGKVLRGSRTNVISAVRSGSSVRLVYPNGAYAFPAQFLKIDGDDLAAMTLNHVSMQTATDNNSEKMIQPDAYWWFTIVTAKGNRDISRWAVGAHTKKQITNDKIGLVWFVQK